MEFFDPLGPKRCMNCGRSLDNHSFTTRYHWRGWKKGNIKGYVCLPVCRTYEQIVSKYSISEFQLRILWDKQGRACAMCGKKAPIKGKGCLVRDHDHACCPLGESCGSCLRGLLCSPCNLRLGTDEKNDTLSEAQKEYLGTSPTLVKKILTEYNGY